MATQRRLAEDLPREPPAAALPRGREISDSPRAPSPNRSVEHGDGNTTCWAGGASRRAGPCVPAARSPGDPTASNGLGPSAPLLPGAPVFIPALSPAARCPSATPSRAWLSVLCSLRDTVLRAPGSEALGGGWGRDRRWAGEASQARASPRRVPRTCPCGTCLWARQDWHLGSGGCLGGAAPCLVGCRAATLVSAHTPAVTPNCPQICPVSPGGSR